MESTSYQSKATSSSLVPARSSSVDRRSTYGQRDRYCSLILTERMSSNRNKERIWQVLARIWIGTNVFLTTIKRTLFRLNSYEQVMRGSTSAATASSEKKHVTPFRQSWLQVVEATNIKGAPVQSRRLWFTVLPGKLTAYSGASTQSDAEFVLRLRFRLFQKTFLFKSFFPAQKWQSKKSNRSPHRAIIS